MEEQKIKVENRSDKYLVDSIPNTNIKFIWSKTGSYVLMTKEQIKELYSKPGGKRFFENLIIHDKDLCKELLGEQEPEYYYTQADIDKLLLQGSLEELEDAIDFSPAGGVDLIVRRAVELKIPDHNKRLAIEKMTGYNINGAIELGVGDNKEEQQTPIKKERRVKKQLVIPS